MVTNLISYNSLDTYYHASNRLLHTLLKPTGDMIPLVINIIVLSVIGFGITNDGLLLF